MKMMKNIVSVLLMMALVAVAGCSRETVPPAAKGKILSTAGYSADVKETGKYWLTWFEDMVILDTSTQTKSQTITVKMKDDLDLTFTVNFRTRISGSDQTINAMFNDITHENYEVSLDKVYNVYGRDVVQKVAREVMGAYFTKDVSRNFKKINEDLHKEMIAAMKNSPLEVSNVSVGQITWPKLITEAVEKQQERELAIQTEANDQAVKMVIKENELKLAVADYDIRMTKAKAIRDENAMTAQGLNPILLEYRRIEMMEKMAENKSAVFMPYEAMSTPGAQARIYSK